tara:strand:- start:239 stop:517 length:279 start_codon:yes stop_codon:yes gene_type:complete
MHLIAMALSHHLTTIPTKLGLVVQTMLTQVGRLLHLMTIQLAVQTVFTPILTNKPMHLITTLNPRQGMHLISIVTSLAIHLLRVVDPKVFTP